MKLKQCIKLFKAWADYYFNARHQVAVKKNPNGTIDKTLYVVGGRFEDGYRHLGLGNIENIILTHCIYAYKKGYIPVVDMKNYSSMYQEENEKGKVNTWENFYCQPGGYSLNDVPNAKKVIYSNACEKQFAYLNGLYGNNEKLRAKVFAYYIKILPELKKRIDSEWENISENSDNIIGCVCRGTDIIGLNWNVNYPTVEKVTEHLKQLLKDKRCCKIYFATEDADVFDNVTQDFGNEIIYSKAERFSVQVGKYLADYAPNRENDKYLRGVEYLTVLQMLSYCKAITGMIGTATAMACVRNPKLKIIYI